MLFSSSWQNAMNLVMVSPNKPIRPCRDRRTVAPVGTTSEGTRSTATIGESIWRAVQRTGLCSGIWQQRFDRIHLLGGRRQHHVPTAKGQRLAGGLAQGPARRSAPGSSVRAGVLLGPRWRFAFLSRLTWASTSGVPFLGVLGTD